MSVQRFSVKYFVQGEPQFDLETLIPVFQRWIQQHTVEGLLLDVADYKHIHSGPGIVLLGHEGDYAFDLRGGRPGLAYTRKREHEQSLAAGLRSALRLAADACQKLEAEAELRGLRFAYDEVEIVLLDRLNAPNTPDAFERIRPELQSLAADLYQTEAAQVEPVEPDPRKSLTVRIAVSQETAGRPYDP
jgi:hypothetical protein